MTATTATLGRHRADRRKNGSHMGAADEQEMMGQTVCNILQFSSRGRETRQKRMDVVTAHAVRVRYLFLVGPPFTAVLRRLQAIELVGCLRAYPAGLQTSVASGRGVLLPFFHQ